MDWQRSVLVAAIVMVFGLLFIRWNEFQAQNAPNPGVDSEQEVLVPSINDTPTKNQLSESLTIPEQPKESSFTEFSATQVDKVESTDTVEQRLIQVTTDVLHVTIDRLGGDIVKVALLNHLTDSTVSAKPFVMLNRTAKHTYIAQSGLIGPNGTDTNDARPLFEVDRYEYYLDENKNELLVRLTHTQGQVRIDKEFLFTKGDYLIGLRYQVDNQSDQAWEGFLFGQIKRDSYNPTAQSSMRPQSYLGPALSTEEDNYKKLPFEDVDDGAFSTRKEGGWIAMVQHYFVSAWIPSGEQVNNYSVRKLGNSADYVFGFTAPLTKIGPREQGLLSADFFVGPKDQYRLEEISPYLDLTIDYGWLWWIAKPLFAGLYFFHSLVGNWGWAIILLTVLVKVVFYPLSAASYRSMAKLRKLQPEMARLKDLYGDDRQKMSQELMAFYKKEKVNPMGGCLPMLIQMPVFIALYWVLNESVELRHAPWMLWITDLSIKDPYFVLPILNGIAMYFLQTLQPAPPDPTQAKVMKFMPVAFSFFFMFFPAGLVLYWTVNSILSIAQQWTITKKIVES